MKHTKGLNSARMRHPLYNLPKRKTKILNPPLPQIEIIEDSYEVTSDNDLEGQGIEKIIIPSKIIYIYTRLEVLLGLNLPAHSDTLTEASNLIDEFYKKGEIENKQCKNALDKFHTNEMELPNKLLQQIAFNTRPKVEEHMLIVMDKSTHTEHLSQPLQTNNKQFKIAITFLTGYNGIFNVRISNNKFYFAKSITDRNGFIQITITHGAYEIESLNNEIKRIIIEGHFTEADFPFTIKPSFSTLGSIIEISRQEPLISSLPNDCIRNLLVFNAVTIYEEYNLSSNPVDILSFDNIFLECDIAQGTIFRRKRNGIIHIFTMDVDPGYEYIEKFRGGVQ